MNNPPKHHRPVEYDRLESFVARAGTAVGLPDEKASLLARLLSTNDLRGVFSHGTRQIATYARLMRDGVLNNKPEISTVQETAVSLFLDGDGGLGYFPSYEGTTRLAEKARESGIAVLATRNHGHFGAAGIYARIPLQHDLLTYVTSGHQLRLTDESPLYSAAGGSPMAFSVPSKDGDPIVVDFGCMHDLYANDPHRDEVARLTPGLVLRSIGLGEICQTWGGFLTGLGLDKPAQPGKWEGANQGALMISFRIDLFSDPEEFKAKVGSYIERIRTLSPIPGFEESFAAGAVEALREREYREQGVPVDDEHMGLLTKLADELGIDPP